MDCPRWSTSLHPMARSCGQSMRSRSDTGWSRCLQALAKALTSWHSWLWRRPRFSSPLYLAKNKHVESAPLMRDMHPAVQEGRLAVAVQTSLYHRKDGEPGLAPCSHRGQGGLCLGRGCLVADQSELSGSKYL